MSGFVGSRIAEFSNHWLAPPLGLAALAAGGLLLLRWVSGGIGSDRAGRRAGAEPGSPLPAVLTLLAVSVAVAAAAALAGIYPLVGLRQSTYLGPALFTGAGALLAAATDAVRPLCGRVASAGLFAVLVGAAVWTSARAPRPDPPADRKFRTVARALAAQAGSGDFLVVGAGGAQLRFHLAESGPDSPREWTAHWLTTWRTPCARGTACVGRAIASALSLPTPPDDLFVTTHAASPSSLRRYLRSRDDRARVDFVVAEGRYGLYRIPDAGPMLERVEERQRARLRALGAGDWGEPTIRSRFDLYEREGALFYHRAACSPADARRPFFLAPAPGRPGSAGDPEFEPLRFRLTDFGARVDGNCLARVPVPFGASLRTGQESAVGAPVWVAAFRFGEAGFREALAAIASGAWGAPAARADFDLWRRGAELWYHRSPCAAAEAEPRFFLHLRGGARGFENRDFDFAEFGLRVDGACLASVPLPAGGASGLSTGQWIRGGPALWRAEVPLGDDFHRAAMDSVASGERGRPVGAGRFDLYRDGADLLLYSPRCTEEAVAPKFVMSFHPPRPEDLPPARRRIGFEEFEFSFADLGAVLDGRCLARAPLPAYEVHRVRVGQVSAAGTPLWSAEYSPE